MGEHAFSRFSDFYPFYLSQHSDRTCRRLHFVGTSLGLLAVLHAFATLNFWWLLAGLAAGYAFAWVGHFEKNRRPRLRIRSTASWATGRCGRTCSRGESGHERNAEPVRVLGLGRAVAGAGGVRHDLRAAARTSTNARRSSTRCGSSCSASAARPPRPLIWALNFTDAASTVHAISRFVASIALIRLLGFTVFRLLLPLAGSQPPRIVEDLGIVAVYVIYGFAQLRGAGLDLSSIVTTSAIPTAVVAFAMQDTLGNVLAGVAVQLDNSVRIGDWIRVDTASGRVRDIRWRSTPDRNAQLGNRGGAEQHADEGARRDPRPARRARRCSGGASLNFMVDPRAAGARDRHHRRRDARAVDPQRGAHAHPELRAEGLRRRQPLLPAALLPHRPARGRPHRLHGARAPVRFAAARRHPRRRAAAHDLCRDARPGARRDRAAPRAHAPTQALASVPPFAALPEETKADIAERLQYALFARGDITKQGNKANWLYILALAKPRCSTSRPAARPASSACARRGVLR